MRTDAKRAGSAVIVDPFLPKNTHRHTPNGREFWMMCNCRLLTCREGRPSCEWQVVWRPGSGEGCSTVETGDGYLPSFKNDWRMNTENEYHHPSSQSSTTSSCPGEGRSWWVRDTFVDMWVEFDVIGLGKIQLKWRVSLMSGVYMAEIWPQWLEWIMTWLALMISFETLLVFYFPKLNSYPWKLAFGRHSFICIFLGSFECFQGLKFKL